MLCFETFSASYCYFGVPLKNITGCLENTNLENADLENADLENTRGGHLGILGVGMCRPGLQIGNPF